MPLEERLDTHARPPELMRGVFKRWQKATLEEIEASPEILDLRRDNNADLLEAWSIQAEDLQNLDGTFLNFSIDKNVPNVEQIRVGRRRYHVEALPGLFIYPSLLPEHTQVELLDKLLHRDLSDPKHKTNIDLHYEIDSDLLANGASNGKSTSRLSFFAVDKNTPVKPKDAEMHKPISVKQMLEKKLRWVTLGGQYDWTSKVYPLEKPPRFPDDISNLLRSLFPDVDAQAAIVNLYSPGDTLSVHRDVSEECARGLISVSIGCDGLFIIGSKKTVKPVVLRLRSGDAVLMSGESRFAWHAVPKILPNTCPASMQDWPASTLNQHYHSWKGWLANKRINLNVRQMRVEPFS